MNHVATWKPEIRNRPNYCPWCGLQLILIDENTKGTRTMWKCHEHGAWEIYHPYPIYRIEKWPRSR